MTTIIRRVRRTKAQYQQGLTHPTRLSRTESKVLDTTVLEVGFMTVDDETGRLESGLLQDQVVLQVDVLKFYKFLGTYSGANETTTNADWEEITISSSALSVVNDIVADASTTGPGNGLPAATEGQRYILQTNTSSLDASWGTIDGVGDNDVVIYTSGTWTVDVDVSSTGEGVLVYNKAGNTLHYYDGSSWVQNEADIYQILGVTVGDTDMGTFPGSTISDNVSTKTGMTELEAASETNATNHTNHLADASGAHAASAISYDNTTSGLTATDAKAAIDEVEGRVDTAETNIGTNATNHTDHLNDTLDAHDASAISYDNTTSGLTASQTNAAIDEVYAEKGSNNGIATLDGGGKIPSSQLPSSVMEYKGTWNASTNTPTLADGIGDNGDVYLTTVAGSQDLGSGSITFAAGDWVVYNGSIWEKSINSNAVVSVNSQTGVVVLDTDDVSEGGSSLYFTNARVLAAVLTGFTSGAGAISATDTVLTAMQKADGNTSAHVADTGNPHSVTKSQVGLSNVTDDAQLPLAGGTMTGDLNMGSNNIITTGNVDGRDVSADGTAQDSHIAASSAHGTSGDVVGTTDTQSLTNKDIDGVTATNSSRITLPKAGTGALNALTRKQGTLVYDITTNEVKYDDGSNLNALGSASVSTATPSAEGLVTSYSPTIKSSILSSPSVTITITETDGYETIVCSHTSNQTVNLPGATLSAGRTIIVVKSASGGKVTVDGSGGDLINAGTTFLLPNIYDVLVLKSDGSKWFISSSTLQTTESTSPSSNVTLTNDSPSTQIINPSADIDFTLPTTDVKAGKIITIHGNGAEGIQVIIKSSNGVEIDRLGDISTNSGGSWSGTVKVFALIDTPTTPADWRVIEVTQSGTYTPTTTEGNWNPTVTNFESAYSRNGSAITVHLAIAFSGGAPNATDSLDVSLPVQAGILNSRDLSGEIFRLDQDFAPYLADAQGNQARFYAPPSNRGDGLFTGTIRYFR
jgi:hypothetical protein